MMVLKFNYGFSHLLLAAILLSLPAAPVFSDGSGTERTASEAKTKKKAEKWTPTFKGKKRRRLSQRERRTGIVLEDRGGVPASQLLEKEPAAKKPGKKHGFWPFNRKKKESGHAKAPEGSGKAAPAAKVTGTEAATGKHGWFAKHRKGHGKATADGKKAAGKDEKDKRKAKKEDPLKQVDENYVKGKDSFDRGNYKKAIRYFENYLNASKIPNNPLEAPALYFMAKSWAKEGQADVAVHLFQKLQKEFKDRQFWAGLAGYDLAALQQAPQAPPPK